MKVRRKLAVEAARDLLQRFPSAQSPAGRVDPTIIAAELGVEIRFFSLDENLSGFMLMEKSKPLIGVNQGDGAKRQRYTIAHELGHYILHDRSEPFLDTQTARARIINRDQISSQGIDPREIEANVFAAELLMPEERLTMEIERLGELGILESDETEIRDLAELFDVSVRAMTIRLERLGFLSMI